MYSPYVFTEWSTEKAINNRVSGWIERRQTLYESGDCDIRLSFGYMPINLKEIEDYVRTPAKDKHWNIESFFAYIVSIIIYVTFIIQCKFLWDLQKYANIRIIMHSDYCNIWKIEKDSVHNQNTKILTELQVSVSSTLDNKPKIARRSIYLFESRFDLFCSFRFRAYSRRFSFYFLEKVYKTIKIWKNFYNHKIKSIDNYIWFDCFWSKHLLNFWWFFSKHLYLSETALCLISDTFNIIFN